MELFCRSPLATFELCRGLARRALADLPAADVAAIGPALAAETAALELFAGDVQPRPASPQETPWTDEDLNNGLGGLPRRLLEWWLANAQGRQRIPFEELARHVWGKEAALITTNALKAALKEVRKFMVESGCRWTLGQKGSDIVRS